MLPVPEFQTKVPLYGRDHSRKVQAMKQAKDRKKQLARLGQTSTLDFTPLSLDKLEPEFVSEGKRRWTCTGSDFSRACFNTSLTMLTSAVSERRVPAGEDWTTSFRA